MSPIILEPTLPPGLTLSMAQLELAARGFDYLSPTRMTIMLNAAKNALEDVWEFPWLEAVATGPAPLVIPDLKYVVLVNGSGQELLGADVRGLAADGADLAQTGTAERWYLTDQVGDAVTMRVWPTAAAALSVIYIRRSPELINPNDRPLIPARYHPVWLDLAVIEAYHDSDNFSGAQALRAEVNARLAEMIETYETRNRQHSVLNTVRGGSEDD